jgi:hypothetical protein
MVLITDIIQSICAKCVLKNKHHDSINATRMHSIAYLTAQADTKMNPLLVLAEKLQMITTVHSNEFRSEH